MPKKRAKYTQPTDENQFASVILDLVTDEKPTKQSTPKNPKSIEAGRGTGSKGGLARAAALTPAKRKRIAQNAARKRWES